MGAEDVEAREVVVLCADVDLENAVAVVLEAVDEGA